MDAPLEGQIRLMHHRRLGMLRWNPASGLWTAATNQGVIRDQVIGVGASAISDPELDLAADFLEWVQSNLEEFRARAAREAFNYDLIWDDGLDEGELASKLTIQSVNVHSGRVEVWFDTNRATTDHLLLARLDKQFKIDGMKL